MIINIILQIKTDCLNSKIIEINLNAFIELLLSKNDLNHDQPSQECDFTAISQ